MSNRELNEAVQRAMTYRLLRAAEMSEARRVRTRLRQPTPDGSVPFGIASVAIERRMQQLVEHARKWNRQLIIAERAVRAAMFAKHSRRHFFAGRDLQRTRAFAQALRGLAQAGGGAK